MRHGAKPPATQGQERQGLRLVHSEPPFGEAVNGWDRSSVWLRAIGPPDLHIRKVERLPGLQGRFLLRIDQIQSVFAHRGRGVVSMSQTIGDLVAPSLMSFAV